MNNIIDSITLRYDLNNNSKKNELVELSEWLRDNYSDTYEERIKADGSKRYVCKIRNFIVSVDPRYVFITGSIHKFYVGNNVVPMVIDDVPKAVELINTLLGDIIDVKKAYLRRLDFGINVIMRNKPAVYINKLHTASSKVPFHYSNQTIRIGNNSRGILIYDKTSEIKKQNRKHDNNVVVPDNMIRIESYIKGRKVFERYFGTQLPSVDLLLQNVGKLPDILLSDYADIDKEYKVNFDKIKNQKDLFRYTIVSTGYDQCQQIINYSFDVGTITKQDRYRLHNTVKAAYKQQEHHASDDLIKELDDKVHSFCKQLKS